MSEGHDKKNVSLAYVPELDGLRGIAIIAVMLFHFKIPFIEGGFLGVDIFFVLSGFLITSLFIQEFDKLGRVNLRFFYMRRVLRLGPALICMLLVFCLVGFVVLSKEKAIENSIDALISLVYLSNWTRAFMLHPPDFLGHTWSLSIEEQYYILWPVVLLVLLRTMRDRKYIVLIAALVGLISWLLRFYLAMCGAPVERLYNGLDTRADALMVGCVLGILISSGLVNENRRKLLLKWLMVIAPCSMVGVFSFFIFARWQDQEMYLFGFLIIELLTAALILDILVNRRSIIAKILSARWLIWVGSISYGLYLWHYPIYRMLFAMKFDELTIVWVGMLMTFSIATCSYYFLERPMLKLKKYYGFAVSNKSTRLNEISRGDHKM